MLWFAFAGGALAQCSPEVGGVVTCSATPGPVTFTEPPVTTLNVNALTGNIAAAGAGQAGIQLTSTRATPGTPGDSLVDGTDGTAGSSAGAININLVGSGPGFTLTTSDGIGIEARSVGGGGGSGGDGVGGAVLPGLGGDGAGGGAGGAVSVITTGAGTVTTAGDNHHGILGLSQGGNGGNGGDGDTVLGVFGSGGDGGAGGAPSSVTISNVLNINANGTGSAGIWAQSVGAAGGNGGDVSGSAFGDGGDGAASSSGGAVSVTSGGVINTTGWNAAGIYAQSVGGFAGSGGGAYGLFSFGGSPASAGSGGLVTVETLANSSINTLGQNSHGIFAQSVGGGGGAGGDGVGVVGFGGAGGGAGNGQNVTVTSRSAIDTGGNGAGGIFAQSVGGGGGTGGTGVGVATIGGFGGGGGTGGVVEVQNSGGIITRGDGEGFETGAYGIFAQSVGGGGGSGALGAGVFAFGGSGGAAGDGQNVTVGNTATITSGCISCRFTGAIYAQSVGGGGGRGGGGAGVLSMGASGGGGGNAGEVRVTNSNTLITTGEFARGIFAQSVGGGGGDGGFGGGLFTIGGSGAAGGDGRYVSVVNHSNITTNGADSAGIFAQSVGGGGGSGGNTIGVGVFFAMSIGGTGGDGGDGSNVDVNRVMGLGSSVISTSGDRSVGILAQSIGGGGGAGGFAVAASGGPFASATLTFGGSGGSGGNAGNVWVGANGSINTNGSFASGIVAESIGGGGGRGGFAISAAGSNGVGIAGAFGADGGDGGFGGLVDVLSSVNITAGCAACTQSNGILASSIGGGGGTGGFAIAAGVGLAAGIGASFGGDGGLGNYGQVVNVTNTGFIFTQGTFSNGILAQSLGGGGGNAGFAASGSFSLSGGNSSFSFGGDGGTGSHGSKVTVANTGNITTTGDFSNGILAQSIGGGGGNGGFSGSIGFSVNGTSSAISFGGDGGEGSDGDEVVVHYSGAINTSGNFSSGILAQSLGGGGGSGGFSLGASGTLKQPNISSSVGGDAGNGGLSKKVTVTDIVGSITTTGEQSHGILAQSIGGGGGTGGFSIGVGFSLESDNLTNTVGGDGGLGKQAGEVEVVSSAVIETGGLDGTGVASHGILAQSIGGGGGTGGFSGNASFTYSGDTKAFSTGGTGGSSGKGNNVSVASSGRITTHADSSVGIFAQSVGGGGGVGGFSIAAGGSYKGSSDVSSVGGDAGAAGDAGQVRVKVLADIDTYGSLSHGVLAQSIGGGGGYGGFSIAGALSVKADASTQSVGGSGGGSGIGEYVEVLVGTEGLGGPTIHTRGLGAVGVLAQSIGGGGGTGGFAGALSVAVDGKSENDVTGGNGGDGSIGGKVVVKNYGTIITDNNASAGILAQSIGGGGGNGGFSIAGAFESEGDGAKNSVGGDGGFGAKGGEVEVTNGGIITTSGDFSHGIFAQSVGGGGGNGGFSIAGTISDSGSGATSSVGGNGGSGGEGGNVTVINTGTITVTGQNSQGIYAQSVGGSGGSGGIAGAFDFGGGGIDNLVGGDGAKGGNGGDVYVESTGSIHTSMANSTGVFAQSVGGSGGWAGLALGVGEGGGGSSGIKVGLGSQCNIVGDDDDDPCNIVSLIPVDGSTGKVTVIINGVENITEGALSYGMLAQSIAGGGGAAATVILDELGFSGSDVELAAGSDGSMGGNASFADNDYNTDHTSTAGVGAIGLIVQSIGGGGGVVGNVNTALVLNPTDPPDDGFYLSVGGYSAGALYDLTGSGGGFKLDAAGTVTTTAANSIGIIGQTIGGGGGIVNLTVSTVTNDGDELVINVGGSQLSDGTYFGNAVADPVTNPVSTLTAAQLVTTSGALSHGIVAQSIGGGGGVSNVVFENGVVLANGTDITIGSGAGGAGGIGGNLIVNANGVTTTGNGAFGIVAQSIGGGGGLVGVASGQFVLGQDGYSLNPLSIGGGTGAGGDSGAVTVASTGDIHAAGYGAHGIVAQSIAGGGGIVGNGMFVTDIADASANGSFAGSLGHAGTAGAVGITQTRNVVVTGVNAVGIFGQSAGGTANGNVTMMLNQGGTNGNGVGLVWASNGTGAAVQIADGATNAFSTNGTLYAQGSIYGSGLPRLDGMTILGGAGDDAITNLARAAGATITNFTRTSNIIGNVDLGAGANSLVNQSGALFISDASVILGAGNLLTNEGLLSPGDRARVRTTGVTGNTTQTATGTYYIDIDLNAQNTPDQVNDLLDISGDGDFAGAGGLLLTSINKAFSNDGYVIASAGGTMTDNGFLPDLDPPAVGFIFSTDVVGSDLVLLAEKPSIMGLLQDPASGTTDPNVWRMGEGIDNIEQAIDIDDPFNYLINLLRLQPDEEALGDAVTTLTPHGAPHMFELADRRTTDFLDHAAQCGNGLVGDVLDNRGCVWIDGTGGQYNRTSVLDSPETEDTWGALSFGGQAVVYDKLTFGASGGYGQISSKQTIDGEQLSAMSGNMYQAGVSAAYEDGSFGVSVAAAGTAGAWESSRFVDVGGYSQGYSSFDGIAQGVADVGELPVFTDKTIDFEGVGGWAKADRQIYAFNPRVRLSYATDPAEGVKAIGLFDIEGHVLYTPEATETGAGLANLVYPEMTQTAVTLTPGFELRLSHELENGYEVTGYVRGGVQWSPWKDEWVAETQFAAAPDGLPAIEMIEPFDDVRGKLDVGLMFACPTSGMQLTVNYAGVYGATTTQHAVKGGFSVPMGGPEKSGC
ncbi:hypothetical protein [Devosia sp. CN2-171]|uniref:hypothetical protein n=1 Tax=Devosia sp. CN2-171 TaxID=3400909 RepID=UPI003BF78786